MKFMRDYGAVRFGMFRDNRKGPAHEGDTSMADMQTFPTEAQLNILRRVSRMVVDFRLERSDATGRSLMYSIPGESVDEFLWRAWRR